MFQYSRLDGTCSKAHQDVLTEILDEPKQLGVNSHVLKAKGASLWFVGNFFRESVMVFIRNTRKPDKQARILGAFTQPFRM